MKRDAVKNAIENDGYAILPQLLGGAAVGALLDAIESGLDSAYSRRREGTTFAIRNLLNAVPAVRALAGSPDLLALVQAVLGERARPVKAILFDKTPQANWKVPWHQDQTIAVAERREAEGFGPWSMKAGIHHVQPPAEVLEGMLAVRVHLDDCDAENGALRVVPGSHRRGKLTDAEIQEAVERGRPVMCPVAAGGALLMKPLLLHNSSASANPRHRRVVHIEYAAGDLPHGLRWFDSSAAEEAV